MQTILHKAEERGKADYGWLSTRYSFSFANWYDPNRMGFGALRVINDDRIAPKSGFPMHSHRDMEIITIVFKGEVTHKDSLGNTGKVSAGDVQVMSAGSGVTHSEFNERDEALELFQIWIEPKEYGIEPRYEERHFDFLDKSVRSVQLVGKDALFINQDAGISYVVIDKDNAASYDIVQGNGVYILVIEGSATVGGIELHARDALGITETDSISFLTGSLAKLLIIEVPINI